MNRTSFLLLASLITTPTFLLLGCPTDGGADDDDAVGDDDDATGDDDDSAGDDDDATGDDDDATGDDDDATGDDDPCIGGRFARLNGVDLGEAPDLAVGAGTTALTLEAWVATGGEAGTWYRIIASRDGASGNQLYTADWALAIDTVNRVNWITGAEEDTCAALIGPELEPGWHHIAVTIEPTVGSGGNKKMFIDGVGVADCTYGFKSADPPGVTTTIGGGWYDGARGGWFQGHIDEFRASSGVKYAADFTPPTRAVDEADTLRLYHFEDDAGTLTDAAGSSDGTLILDAAAPAGTTPAVAMWNTTHSSCDAGIAEVIDTSTDTCTAGYFGDFLGASAGLRQARLGNRPDAVLTVEAWIKPADRNEATGIAVQQAPSNSYLAVDWGLFLETDETLRWITGPDDGGCAVQWGPQLTVGQWHHVAATLEATGAQTGTKQIFLDGVLTHTCQYTAKNAEHAQSARVFFGGHLTTNNVQGQMFAAVDELRISREVLYTGDFTPSTYPGVRPSTLLLHHFDEGTGPSFGDASPGWNPSGWVGAIGGDPSVYFWQSTESSCDAGS